MRTTDVETTSKQWISKGKPYVVRGLLIDGGMFYVGKSDWSSDASLIDLALEVQINRRFDDPASQLSNWPSYRDASESARGAYLQWLAEGKSASNAAIGYVFPYFYGLERRCLIDAASNPQAAAELPQIEEEIQRLLVIYGTHPSFFNYASSLLYYLRIRYAAELPLSEIPPNYNGGYPSWYEGVGFSLKAALGLCAVNSEPVPGELAFEWWRHHGGWGRVAERCPEELKQLFLSRYQEEYGEGLKLPVNRARLAIVHRAANHTLPRREFTYHLNLPDVDCQLESIMKLQAIGDNCKEALGAYSRHLGRNPGNRGKLDALLELPAVLWPEAMKAPLSKIHWMVSQSGKPLIVKFEKLLSLLPPWAVRTKASYAVFTKSLSQVGIGIEPDPRFGGACPGDSETIVMFVDAPNALSAGPSTGYQAASLSLHLAVAVSLADGEMAFAEREVLMCQLEAWLHLDASDRTRLQAYLRWLVSQPPGLVGLKKRIEAVDQPGREVIGDFLVRVAHADGSIAAAEIELLEILFKHLELDPASLYRKPHPTSSEPVTVRPSAEGSYGFAIPKPPSEKLVDSLNLDFAKVAFLEDDSRRVADILHMIFQEPYQEVLQEPDEESTNDRVAVGTPTDKGLWGLTPELRIWSEITH